LRAAGGRPWLDLFEKARRGLGGLSDSPFD
jgi:hypothetical protein